jgi:hypothetical protein
MVTANTLVKTLTLTVSIATTATPISLALNVTRPVLALLTVLATTEPKVMATVQRTQRVNPSVTLVGLVPIATHAPMGTPETTANLE